VGGWGVISSMDTPWKDGDRSAAVCGHCGAVTAVRYVRRAVVMPRTRLRVRDVLVAVCGVCDAVASMPRQSIAQLRECGVGK
jgi:hypothetical protein